MRSYLVSTIAFAAVLALSGCSGEKSADASVDASEAATEAAAAAVDAASADKAGPGLSGAVAPGVAFTYNYAFTLPSKAIAQIQQQHAAACERLGATRCRVTGMRYEQPGEDRVEARLDFLLAPDLAHRFGSEGIAAVEAADGKLANATVNGENAGDAIVLSQQDSAAVTAEIARLDARLKAKGLTAAERVELQRRVDDLHQQLQGQSSERRSKEASLATTPVSFAYASEGLLGGGNTFGKAASASWGSMESALSFVLLLAGVALPWIGLIALLVLGWRWLKRRAAPAPVLGASEPSPTS